jgi:hypothetical protein
MLAAPPCLCLGRTTGDWAASSAAGLRVSSWAINPVALQALPSSAASSAVTMVLAVCRAAGAPVVTCQGASAVLVAVVHGVGLVERWQPLLTWRAVATWVPML